MIASVSLPCPFGLRTRRTVEEEGRGLGLEQALGVGGGARRKEVNDEENEKAEMAVGGKTAPRCPSLRPSYSIPQAYP